MKSQLCDIEIILRSDDLGLSFRITITVFASYVREICARAVTRCLLPGHFSDAKYV